MSAKTRERVLVSRERIANGEQLHDTIRTGIRWGGIGLISYFALQAVRALAGHLTVADLSVVLQILGKEQPAKSTLGITNILAVGWAILERRLRKRTIKRLAPRAARAETQVDPNRSSSTLTLTGDTNPSDR